MTLGFHKDEVRHLSLRLVDISLKPNVEELAKVALELILSKRSAIEVAEGNYSKELKAEAKKALAEFEELEERIVRIYGMGLLSEAEWTRHPAIKAIIGKIGRKREVGAVAHERRV